MSIVRRLIGITGGIGTGKSTVTDYVRSRYGLPIWDADIYARQAVEFGSPILSTISHRYGAEILLADGNLDRARLGEMVFNLPEERKWLESQIHPYVRDRFEREIDNLPDNSTAILAIPLLFEAKMTDLVTEIWVVSCDLDTQLQRVMMRDRLTLEQAQIRIYSQMPLSEKINLANVILENSGDLDSLYSQIDRCLMPS
jgi:dephospho-CoA kinase